jgi:SulP family sulfate permease
MEGFTLGIAIIIALQQIPLVFGVTKAEGTHTISVAFETLSRALTEKIHVAPISIAFATVTIKRLWPRIKKAAGIRIHLPASIVAITLVTTVTQFLSLDIDHIGELPRQLSFTDDFSLGDISPFSFAYAAIAIALLGAIESLLSARVADGMARKEIDHEQRAHDPKKELMGQGLATIASACVGGLPATGAIARTSVNVHSGARTRLAAIVHALFLLAVVLFLAPIVSLIPTAALAGVLIGTSLRIANPQSVKEALQSTYKFRVIYVVTALAVVFIDLIWGVVIGIFLEKILNKAR